MMQAATCCPPARVAALAMKLASPPYSAVIVWRPAARLEVVREACPPALMDCGAPRFAPLSLNCTVPGGVPAADVTVAVKVTLCPVRDGLTEVDTAALVAALPTVSGPELLLTAKFASPAKPASTAAG